MDIQQLHDNIYTAVARGMLEEIEKVQKSGALSATVIMIYVCIDAMAFLSLPIEKNQQTKSDFISWVDKYLKTDCNQEYQYKGNDVYAARCGKLHNFSAFSEYALKQKTNLFGYHNGSEHIYNPEASPKLVVISVLRLEKDFQNAVLNFFKQAQKDQNLKQRINAKINRLYTQFDIKYPD